MSAVTATSPAPRRRRMTKVLAWVAGVAVFWLVLNLLGVDVRGWIADLWDRISAIPKGYLVAALFFQTLQTFFAGLSYYGILKFAYKDEVTLWPIIAAYAVGVAMNGFLPANIGTFVTLLMFVAIIPSCNVGGAIAAYIVQKIFFTIAGTFVYLYMFLSVPGAFDVSFGGNLKAYPWLTILIIAGGAMLIMIVGRIFWSKVKRLWEQAKQGGAILAEPKTYLSKRSCHRSVLASQDRRDRDLPRCLRHPGDVQLDHVGVRLGFARERRVVHAGRGRRHAGDECAGARRVLRRAEIDGDGLLDRAAADHDGVEPGRRARPRRPHLRLDGRQAARDDVIHRCEGPGSRHEGAAGGEEGGEEEAKEQQQPPPE